MFYYFLEDYKNNVCNASKRKLSIPEWIMIAILGGGVIAYFISMIFDWSIVIKFISLIITALDMIIVNLYIKRRNKKHMMDFFRIYKEKHINELIKLLKSSSYNLYSQEGIDWLLFCCSNQETENSIFKMISSAKNYFLATIYPVFMLILGVLIDDFSSEKIINYSFILIFAMILLFIIYISLKPVVSFVAFPDKEVLQHLQNELRYIKTQFQLNLQQDKKVK